MEQIIKADRWRVSQVLEKKQNRRHACGGLVPSLNRIEKFEILNSKSK
jgi:hypothetical protein